MPMRSDLLFLNQFLTQCREFGAECQILRISLALLPKFGEGFA